MAMNAYSAFPQTLALLEPHHQINLCHTRTKKKIIWIHIYFIRSINIFFKCLSLNFFRQLSSSLLLFPQRFVRYVLQPSSGVCRTREPSWNFELRPLLNPWGSPVLTVITATPCIPLDCRTHGVTVIGVGSLNF